MDEVGLWLKSIGLGNFADAFRKHGISAQSLPLLSESGLREMGIPDGPRETLLKAIASLQPALSDQRVKLDMPIADRRHLTVMFCDMVGSTEYAENLDPEDFRRLMEIFLQTCSGIIQRHNGSVASYIGDAVKAYFGYPRAEEDDAERAVLTGLDILHEVEFLGNTLRRPLQVRLGIASGQVVVGNIFGAPAGVSLVAFGHVTHLAARIQALAEQNTILVDTPTYEASKGAIEFVQFGGHMLKGFAEPVQLWRVERMRLLPSRFARRLKLAAMYGRDQEINQLLTCWNQVCATGKGKAVVVSGEAGIGKSRLLNELLHRLQSPNHLLFQCSSNLSSSTLHPFVTELKRRAQIVETDSSQTKLQKLQDEFSVPNVGDDFLGPIFANLFSVSATDPSTASDISSERHRTATKQIFVDWISRLAQTRPLLVIFEDEQWADMTSRELLSAIIGSLSEIPALLLVSTRTDLDSLSIELQSDLHQTLKPLTTSEVTALIRELHPANLPSEEVLTFVLDRSGGVPLYIEELTRSAIETGLHLDNSFQNRRLADSDIPNSLQSLLLARLDRLGPAKEIAQIAASIGREFDFDLLREVSALPEPAVRAELESLVHSGLIVPIQGGQGLRYSFKHALLQQAAQATMLRDRRQKLHANIGQSLESRDSNSASTYPEILAQHFSDAAMYEKASDYWLLAGGKAAKTWAKVEAAQLFSNGIEAAKLLPDTPERARRLLKLELERGDVFYAAFGYVTGEGSKAYHRAISLSEELGDPEAPIRALDGLFGTHFNSGQFSDAHAASDRLVKIGEQRSNLRALVLGLQFKGMTLFCEGKFVFAREYLERALTYRDRAKLVGSDFPSMAYIYLSWTMHILGDTRKALNSYRQAERIVRQQTPYRLAACLGDGCFLFAFREDDKAITALADELLPLALDNGFNLWTKMARFFQGWTEASANRSIDGTALMQDTIDALEDQEVDKSCYLGLLGKAYLRTAQYDLATSTIDKGLRQSKRIGEYYYTAELLRLRGEIQLASGGDATLAEANFREALALAKSQAAISWERNAKQSLSKFTQSSKQRAGPRKLRKAI